MNFHIAVIGCGRVGSVTAYSILTSGIASKLSLVDIVPNLSSTLAEEFKHVTAAYRADTDLFGFEDAGLVKDADLIVITAGYPRKPGVKMLRRDLARINGKIVKDISLKLVENNPDAIYVVVTNPVDAMAMICKHYTKAEYVISTGTNLESLRFRTRIAEQAKVHVSEVQGFVGGEHGVNAVPLWSTVYIRGVKVDKYKIDRYDVENYVKTISKKIIDVVGGTSYAPASSFTLIVKTILLNLDIVMPVAVPYKFEEIPEPVHVSIPVKLGRKIDLAPSKTLTRDEWSKIEEAAKSIYSTYREALSALES